MLTKRLKKRIFFILLSSAKTLSEGFSEMPRCKAPKVQKSEAYFMYAATMKDEGNAADGGFWEASLDHSPIYRNDLTGNV